MYIVKTVAFLAVLSLIHGCSTVPVKSSNSNNASSEHFTVKPSTDLFLEISLLNGAIQSVTSTPNNDEASLTFSMSEMNNGVMMSVKSQLEKTVKFDLHIVDYRGKRHYTSSCPVMPGSGVFESWGHNIPEIIVSNVRILEENSNVSCE